MNDEEHILVLLGLNHVRLKPESIFFFLAKGEGFCVFLVHDRTVYITPKDESAIVTLNGVNCCDLNYDIYLSAPVFAHCKGISGWAQNIGCRV